MAISAPAEAATHMGPWQLATVLDVRTEAASAKTFRLKLATPHTHVAGQHYVMRLTAPDGYRAQRSYSVASAPGYAEVELTVDLLPGGEVSGFLHEVVRPGDTLEVRGPLGRFFTWDGQSPALGVAGGAGVVPLMSMLRHARALGRPELIRLIVSARGPDDLYYSHELPGPYTTLIYTRQTPPGFGRAPGRITSTDLAPWLESDQQVFVCGTPPFCDSATALLLALDVPTERIRVERFGPSS